MRGDAVVWSCASRWFIWLTPVCLLLCQCAPPTAPLPEDGVKSRAVERADAEQVNNPRQQGERELETRVQAVIRCLETARQAVVAAEVAGAGVEAVQPAVQALQRSEEALRQAQAQLLSGEVDLADAPLDRAEAACRAARAFSGQS